MANLNHLSIPSLSSLSHEAGLDLILSIRERRRFVPDKPVRELKTKKVRSSIPPEAVVANMSEQQITDLYYKLMAKQQKELL